MALLCGRAAALRLLSSAASPARVPALRSSAVSRGFSAAASPVASLLVTFGARCRPHVLRMSDAAPRPVSSAAHSQSYTDVDGTLIHAIGPEANRLHKRAFTHAFKARRARRPRGGSPLTPPPPPPLQEVYNIDASIDEIEVRVPSPSALPVPA